MKRYSKYYFLLAGVLVLGSCKKFTEGLDVSPNSPTSAPYALVLNGAEVSSIGIYEGTLARTAGMFARSFTGADRQYIDLYNYNTTAQDYNDGWDNLYSQVITQFKIVESQALAINDKKTAGIAEIQLAEAGGLAADLWGDVPFSQVGDPTTHPTPAFDSQTAVYTAVQALLDKAITNLAANVGVGPGAKDIFFGGDISKWSAAAHTLKARFYLHTRDYANAIAQAKLGISSAANNVMDPHGTSDDSDTQIYYDFLSLDRPGYMNADGAVAAAYLDSSNPLYHGNAKTDETARFNYMYQEGLNTGALDPNVLSNYDGWGNDANQDGFFGGAVSFPVVTFEENNLILAEAYAKTNDNTNALAALNVERAYMNTGGYINTGYISSGLKYDAYTIADFAPGGIANKGGVAVSQALLTEILTERYLTLIGQIEQYNDVRRTGNYLKIPTTKGTTIPQRFFYAQDEINTNPNTPKLAPADLFKPTTVNSTAY